AASSLEAHAAAVALLDGKERQKYLELFSRTAGRKEKLEAAQVLPVPLSSGQKQKMQSLLQKAITDDEKTSLKSVGGFLQQVGAFFGIFSFTVLAARFGRRASFLIALLLAWASLLLAFGTFHEPWQIWYLWPILGFGALAPF